MSESDDETYYSHQARFGALVELVSTFARKRMFRSFMAAAVLCIDTTVLDVGVTSNRRADSNFFEKMYPWPDQITAVGLDDASFLEHDFPGLKFVRADALNLPFEENSFDLAVSFAVIEHIGSRERQRQFVSELNRVSRAFFITTPNRWYPLEFHTLLPFVHWLPPETFRAILRRLNFKSYAREETLNLLDEKELLALMPSGVEAGIIKFRLLGMVSNLMLYAHKC